jgi:hypothetical protein
MPGKRRAAAALAALAVAFGASALALAGPGCTPQLCTRNSECPAGYGCSSRAQCERLPDAASGGGDAGGGETIDAGTGTPIFDGAVDFDAAPADPPDASSFDAAAAAQNLLVSWALE